MCYARPELCCSCVAIRALPARASASTAAWLQNGDTYDQAKVGHDRARLTAAAAVPLPSLPHSLLQASAVADIDWVRVEGDEVSKAVGEIL